MHFTNYVPILFCLDYMTLIVHMTKIAEVRDIGCYVFSDNSEAILGALEEKDEFDQDFCVTANKASISSLKCLI